MRATGGETAGTEDPETRVTSHESRVTSFDEFPSTVHESWSVPRVASAKHQRVVVYRELSNKEDRCVPRENGAA